LLKLAGSSWLIQVGWFQIAVPLAMANCAEIDNQQPALHEVLTHY
jgi:hypothetical protein